MVRSAIITSSCVKIHPNGVKNVAGSQKRREENETSSIHTLRHLANKMKHHRAAPPFTIRLPSSQVVCSTRNKDNNDTNKQSNPSSHAQSDFLFSCGDDCDSPFFVYANLERPVRDIVSTIYQCNFLNNECTGLVHSQLPADSYGGSCRRGICSAVQTNIWPNASIRSTAWLHVHCLGTRVEEVDFLLSVWCTTTSFS